MRTLLRRIAVPGVIAAAASTFLLSGCGSYAGGGPGIMTGPVPVTPINMVENSGWWGSPDGNYEIDRICLNGTTAYISQNYAGRDSGGGTAYGPKGCVGGSAFRVLGGLQPVDGTGNNRVQAVCDTRNGTLIYVAEMEDAGSIGSIVGGCAEGMPAPGRILPAGPAQKLGGPQDLWVRPFSDSGNGALLYVAESGGDWGSDGNNGGGVSPVQSPTGHPGRIVQLTQWEGPVDTNYVPSSLADFCDMGNGNLLVGSAIGDGGDAQAVPSQCQAVADGRVPLSRYKGPSHYLPTTRWYSSSDGNVNGGLLCGLNNGVTVNFVEANGQGGIGVLRANCLPGARSVGG